jgi:hypothetical protein
MARSKITTMDQIKKELTLWDKKKLAMQMTLSDDMVPEAKAIAKDLINTHKVPLLAPETIDQGETILEDYDKQVTAS